MLDEVAQFGKPTVGATFEFARSAALEGNPDGERRGGAQWVDFKINRRVRSELTQAHSVSAVAINFNMPPRRGWRPITVEGHCRTVP